MIYIIVCSSSCVHWSYFVKYELKLNIQRNKIAFLWWLGVQEWTAILCVWWSVIIWIARFFPFSVPFLSHFLHLISDRFDLIFDFWYPDSFQPSQICKDWLILKDLDFSSLTSGLMFQDFVAYCAKIWCSTRKILVKHTCISLFFDKNFSGKHYWKIICSL